MGGGAALALLVEAQIGRRGGTIVTQGRGATPQLQEGKGEGRGLDSRGGGVERLEGRIGGCLVFKGGGRGESQTEQTPLLSCLVLKRRKGLRWRDIPAVCLRRLRRSHSATSHFGLGAC